MIDRRELEEMQQRYQTAEKAVGAVLLHASDGLFGELPAEEAPPLLTSAVESCRDVPRLLDEVERLSPAAYLSGPEQCAEGDCDDEDPPDGQWCSHVTEKVATLDDVKRAEYLDALVQSLKQAAERAQQGEQPDPTGDGRDLAALILRGADNTYDRIAQWESTGVESTW